MLIFHLSTSNETVRVPPKALSPENLSSLSVSRILCFRFLSSLPVFYGEFLRTLLIFLVGLFGSLSTGFIARF